MSSPQDTPVPADLQGTVATFPAAVNPQPDDLLSGMQIIGPNKAYETVGFTVSQVQGAANNFASPPPIGNTTPNTGSFTNLVAANATAATGSFTSLVATNATAATVTLGSNATGGLEAVPAQQIGYPYMQGTQPAGGFTQSPYPFGTTTEACAFSTQMVPPDQFGRPTLPQVSGYHGPSDLATYADRGYVTFYSGADSAAVTTITVSSATYTATTVVVSPALNSTQLGFVQQAIAINNARAPLWNNAPSYIAANIGMQIDTLHSPKYTGCITAVSSDGTTITCAGGWFQQGNTATGQVPANGVGCYINPCTKMWNQNGVMWLDVSTGPVSSGGNGQCQQMVFLEIDSYNNQAAFSGGTIPTIGISANAHANGNGYAFLANGNWSNGFRSQGQSGGYGFFIQDAGAGNNPDWGYVSAINSSTTAGYHPFGSFDYSINQYRFYVGQNGGLQLGYPGNDNGFAFQVSSPGTAPVIIATGPDTNINLRLHPQGTGLVQIDSGISVAGDAGFNGTTPIAKPTVTGSKGGNAALASLITALANYGLVTDGTT